MAKKHKSKAESSRPSEIADCGQDITVDPAVIVTAAASISNDPAEPVTAADPIPTDPAEPIAASIPTDPASIPPGVDAPLSNADTQQEVIVALSADSNGHCPESPFETLQDVWYAQSGGSDEADLADGVNGVAVADRLERIEVVIGRDDRLRVPITTDYPWRCICSLVITAADDSRWIGTGWLVGPRTIVTAGHCVFIHERGGWVKRVEVIPGRDGGARPFGTRLATRFHSVGGWVNDRHVAHDYGAITLGESEGFGADLGHLGAVDLSTAALSGLRVNLAGYPGDLPAGTQWFHARAIRSTEAQRVVYDVDTAGGQSGAPVWHRRDDERLVVAIHTNGEQAGNSGTRVTAAVLTNIEHWRSLAPDD
jgi:glutamyl endopeptidase